jgi:RNA polymerase sigma-70 factor (sigma-E family)
VCIVNITAGEPGPVGPRHKDEANAGPPDAARGSAPADARWDADQAITALYSTQYRALVRLAVLLVGDPGAAEEMAQDAFVAMHGTWHLLRNRDKALSYLRQSVVHRSRSASRYRTVADRNTAEGAAGKAGADQGAITQERPTVICVLRALPPRQREALVLRFYLDLSEEQAASAMGISQGALRSHTAGAMAALRNVLKPET